MKPDETIMTVEQAAEMFKVPVLTLREWIFNGRLPVIHSGRNVMIARGALETLLVGTCELCGERFRRPNLRARFCSTKCRQRAHRLKSE